MEKGRGKEGVGGGREQKGGRRWRRMVEKGEEAGGGGIREKGEGGGKRMEKRAGEDELDISFLSSLLFHAASPHRTDSLPSCLIFRVLEHPSPMVTTQAILQVVDKIPTIATQLKIITAVKATRQGGDGEWNSRTRVRLVTQSNKAGNSYVTLSGVNVLCCIVFY
jgi:hypothetical protein